MPFFDPDRIEAKEVAPGCKLRTPYGEKLMLSYLQMDEGAEIPAHDHPHEQAGIVIQGELQLTIGDETRVIGPGNMYVIPGGVSHRALAVGGPVTVMDVFHPIREDYAALMNSTNASS